MEQNKLVLWIVAAGTSMVALVIAGGYFLTNDPTTIVNNFASSSPLKPEASGTTAVVPGLSGSSVSSSTNRSSASTATPVVGVPQSPEPILVKTLTIPAKAAKTLAESNDRNGTYLGETALLSTGDIAYTIKHNLSNSLFLNEAKITENVFIMQELAGKLMYISNDTKSLAHSLYYGTEMLATAPVTSLTDMFDVKEIDGKLAYTVYDKASKQKTLFFGGKKIVTGQDIKNFKMTSKGLSYIIHDFSANTDTLYFNGKEVISAYEIPDYLEENNGKLAYTTLTFVDKTPPKDIGGYLGSEYPTTQTLFEDGKKITADGSYNIEIRKISGKLAYISGKTTEDSQQLYFDGNMIQSANSIAKLIEATGKPAYLATDYSSKEARLYLGSRLVAKTKMDSPPQFSEIAGKLEYSKYDSSTRENHIFYDEKELAGIINPFSLKSIDGKLAYIALDKPQPTAKGSLFFDEKKVSGEYDVRNFIENKSTPGIVYFETSKEVGSSTLVSIYKLSLQ